MKGGIEKGEVGGIRGSRGRDSRAGRVRRGSVGKGIERRRIMRWVLNDLINDLIDILYIIFGSRRGEMMVGEGN